MASYIVLDDIQSNGIFVILCYRFLLFVENKHAYKFHSQINLINELFSDIYLVIITVGH